MISSETLLNPFNSAYYKSNDFQGGGGESLNTPKGEFKFFHETTTTWPTDEVE